MSEKQITFSPLNEHDLLLLQKWFSVPHVKQFYARGESFDLDKIKEKYLSLIQDKDNIPNFIVKVDGEAIGYIQFYRLSKYLPEGVTDLNHNIFKRYKPDELAGIDLFISETDMLNKGYGTAVLKAFIDELIVDNFKAVVVDPHIDKRIEINFFEQFGFEDVTDEIGGCENKLLILELNK